jgi:hypothetical protein
MTLGPGQQRNTNVDPTWTWGSSAELILRSTGLVGGLAAQSSAQLAQVQLPEPAVCSLYFQAVCRISNPVSASVAVFTLNLSQGLGRVTIPRSISFAGQPADGAPLEYTLPFLPVHALQVNVSCTANMETEAPSEIAIQVYLVLSPLTRIPQSIQKLQFGMALPGEADALDDELREDLEQESPTVAEIMGQEANERVHGVEGADDDDDDGGDEPQAAPAWMMDLVDALSQRLRRAPTRTELRKAVARMKERQARRAR